MGTIMARKKKSWIEKLLDAKAKEDLPKEFHCDKAKQHMLVPSPAQIEQEIRLIRKRRVKTIKQVTDKLAGELAVNDRWCRADQQWNDAPDHVSGKALAAGLPLGHAASPNRWLAPFRSLKHPHRSFRMKRSPAFPKKPGFCAAIMFENM